MTGAERHPRKNERHDEGRVMWVVGRILLALLLIIALALVTAGIFLLVAADSIADEYNEAHECKWYEWGCEENDVNSGLIRGVGAGGTAIGTVLLVVSSVFLFRRHRPIKSDRNDRPLDY